MLLWVTASVEFEGFIEYLVHHFALLNAITSRLPVRLVEANESPEEISLIEPFC